MFDINNDDISALYNSNYLSDIDIYFARFITGLEKSDDPDIFLAAALVSRAVGNQDGYLDLGSVAGRPIPGTIDTEKGVKAPELSMWLTKIRQTRAVGNPGDFCPLILDAKNRLYLYRYWDYEKKLSDAISQRIKGDIAEIDTLILKDSLNRLFPKNSNDHFNWQKVAAMIAAFKRLCVITGGPGTGKTFTMARILALLLEQSTNDKLKILLAAPTGKAAARIGESIKIVKKTLPSHKDIIDAIPSDAYTIHRMLGTIQGAPYFRHNAENPLNADVVVVDEASMVDLALMSKLVAAVPDDARFILIGDRDQLASVETGFVMADICDPNHIHLFSKYFCRQFEGLTRETINIPDSHQKDHPGLYDCMVVLKKSYRFSGSSGIGKVSHTVNHGKIDETLLNLRNHPDQIVWKKISNSDGFSTALSERVIKGYAEYLNTDDPNKALHLFNRFKILCAVKVGPFGVNSVNRLTEQILTREGLIKLDNFSAHPWYKGRPVLITRNDYRLELFNGDIGITLPAPDSKRKDLFVYFQGAAGEYRRFLPNRLPEHETAYALTVHKSQGSEFESILLILPDRVYPVLTRELLYTGITRAKKKIWLWGSEDIIKTIISHKIARTSGLKDALWG